MVEEEDMAPIGQGLQVLVAMVEVVAMVETLAEAEGVLLIGGEIRKILPSKENMKKKRKYV